jgi:hypothetical protein
LCSSSKSSITTCGNDAIYFDNAQSESNSIYNVANSDLPKPLDHLMQRTLALVIARVPFKAEIYFPNHKKLAQFITRCFVSSLLCQFLEGRIAEVRVPENQRQKAAPTEIRL